MSVYDGVQSLLLRRGERLVPFCAYDTAPDWARVLECWEVIIGAGDRFMTPDEILLLYD